MICVNCRYEMPDGTRFCKNCGSPAEAAAPEQSYAPIQVPGSVPEGWFHCPYCEELLPDDTVYCGVCGEMVSLYVPAEEFIYEPESRLFYRYITDENGTKWVIWFNANTGEQEKINCSGEQAESEPELTLGSEPVPEAESVIEPEPELTPDMIHEPEPVLTPDVIHEPEPINYQHDIPKGFTLDSNSGFYYKATAGRDRTTGIQGNWYTWFNPETGDYIQEFHPY